MRDDTRAIQDAIDDAYPNNFVVFLLSGKIFMVSQQLKLFRPLETRIYGHQLIGYASDNKSVIRLKDGSALEKNVLIFFQLDSLEKGDSPGSHNGFTIRNIHVDMGHNPEAKAVCFSGA